MLVVRVHGSYNIIITVCVFERATYISLSAQTCIYIYIYTTPTDDGVRAVAVYFGEKHFVSGWILFTRVTHSLRNRHNTVGRKQTDTRPTMWNMCRRRRRRCRDGGIVTGVFFPVCLHITFSVSLSGRHSLALQHTPSLFISGSPRNGTCSADGRQIFGNFATATARRRSLRRRKQRVVNPCYWTIHNIIRTPDIYVVMS